MKTRYFRLLYDGFPKEITKEKFRELERKERRKTTITDKTLIYYRKGFLWIMKNKKVSWYNGNEIKGLFKLLKELSV